MATINEIVIITTVNTIQDSKDIGLKNVVQSVSAFMALMYKQLLSIHEIFRMNIGKV